MHTLPRVSSGFVIATGFVLLGLPCLPSQAQVGVLNSSQVGASPQPKLSPYLDLLRNDDSVLSPYHSFVLPRRAIRQQQSVQASQLRHLEYKASAAGSTQRGSSVSRLATGRGGQFQSTLHFFPSASSN